jgi:hypothetical protein
MQKIALFEGGSDVLATRLNPYVNKRRQNIRKVYAIDEVRPVYLSGAFQGIIVCWMPFLASDGTSKPMPWVAIAPDDCRNSGAWSWANYSGAFWNDAFRIWQSPLRQGDSLTRLMQAWELIEEAMFRVKWAGSTIELHWQINLDDEMANVLRGRVHEWNEDFK